MKIRFSSGEEVKTEMVSTARNNWLSGLVLLTGLWLIISPFALGYSDIGSPTTNDVTVGALVALLALVNLIWGRSTAMVLSGVLVLLGLWQVLAPFLLGYTSVSEALVNSMLFGAIVLVLSGANFFTFSAESGARGFGPSYYSEERGRSKSEEAEEKE